MQAMKGSRRKVMVIDLPQEVIDEIFPYLEMRQRQVQRSCDFNEMLAKADYKDNHRARAQAIFQYELCKKELAAFNFIVNMLKSPLLNCGDMVAIKDGVELRNLFDIRFEQGVRKEVAKDILQKLFDKKEFIQGEDEGSYPVVEAVYIIKMAEKYGIEVK